MANFIDLDSIYRDRYIYPNPLSYEVTANQVEGWFSASRSVRAFPQTAVNRPLEFVTTIKLHYLTLPYDESLASIPRLYIDFHCRKYDDRYLVATIDSKHSSSRFIAIFDKIQYDSSGAPMWIHYKSTMEQVVRFKRNDPVVFNITTRDGSTPSTFIDTQPNLPPDPNLQSLATFEVIPYLRDNEFANHQQEPIRPS